MSLKPYFHKWIFAILIGIFPAILLLGQGGVTLDIGQGEEDKGTTRALVIGIANYENESIRLRYTARDATIYAQFLQTAAGGKVSPSNITLLTESKATNAAIYGFLNVIRKKSQSGDRVIIFFSGHGDIETDFQEGYLLAYDTEPNNYPGFAVKVADLKSTLTAMSSNGVDVVLITDACKAGTLAGNAINGNMRTNESMQEIGGITKLLSCQSGELSEEGPWGGGRSVFSYYLLNGLSGKADQDKNNSVSALEALIYLNTEVPRAVSPKKQTPVIESTNMNVELAHSVQGDSSVIALNDLYLDSLSANDTLLLASKGIPKPPVTEIVCSSGDPSSAQLIQLFEQALEEGKLLEPKDSCAYYYFKEIDKRKDVEDKELPKMLLAIALQNEAQKAFKRYVAADTSEAYRKGITADSFLYNYHPEYLETAAKLLGKDYEWKDDLEAKSNYYEAVQIRLDAEVNNKGAGAYRKAVKKLKKASEYLDDAAYLHNELGLNYEALDREEQALDAYKNAQKCSPTWFVPYSNEVGVYIEKGEVDKAKDTAQSAVNAQPKNLGAYLSMGSIFEEEGNWIEAEKQYRAGLAINSKKPLAFERLGYLYLKTGEFGLANEMFYEADLRKSSISGQMPKIEDQPTKDANEESIPDENTENEELATLSTRQGHLLRMSRRNYNDADAHVKLGMIYKNVNNDVLAERRFRNAIEVTPRNLDAYNQLLDLMLKQNRFAPAELALNKTQDLQPGSNLNISMGLYRSWQRYDQLENTYLRVDSIALLYEHYLQERRFSETFDLALKAFSQKKDYAEFGKWVDFMTKNDPYKTDQYFQTGLYWSRESMYTPLTTEFAKSGNQLVFADGQNKTMAFTEMADRASQAFQKVLALDSNYTAKSDIYRRLSELNRIKTNAAQRNYLSSESETKLLQETLDYLNKAIAESPDNLDLQLQKINALLELRQFDSTLVLLEKMHEAHQLDISGELTLAKLWFYNGKRAEAKGLLDNLERSFMPPSAAPAEFFRLRALWQMSQDKKDEAIADLEQVMSKSYNSTADYYQQARLLLAKGDEERALAVLNGAMENGFRYERVVKYDPMLQKIRGGSLFDYLLSKFSINPDQPRDKSRY
ncbi:MAG: caspase family protein [Saprospiraceae bacterium]|nr:caspase family protein [Saprospiraceae bacterium]